MKTNHFVISSFIILLLETLLVSAAVADAPYEVLMAQGRQQYAAKDLNAAAATFRQYISIRPQDPQGYFWLGLILDGEGNNEEAMRTYASSLEKAKQLGMDSAELRVDLANTLVKLNYFKEAIYDYKRAIEIEPAMPAAHINLIKTQLQSKHWPQALLAIDNAQRAGLTDPVLTHLKELALKGSAESKQNSGASE